MVQIPFNYLRSMSRNYFILPFVQLDSLLHGGWLCAGCWDRGLQFDSFSSEVVSPYVILSLIPSYHRAQFCVFLAQLSSRFWQAASETSAVSHCSEVLNIYIKLGRGLFTVQGSLRHCRCSYRQATVNIFSDYGSQRIMMKNFCQNQVLVHCSGFVFPTYHGPVSSVSEMFTCSFHRMASVVSDWFCSSCANRCFAYFRCSNFCCNWQNLCMQRVIGFIEFIQNNRGIFNLRVTVAWLKFQ